MNKTLIEQLRGLPNDLSNNSHNLKTNYNDINHLDNFIKELGELSKRYNLYIQSWTGGSGAWIKDGNTKNDILYDLCWSDETQKYEYELDND